MCQKLGTTVTGFHKAIFEQLGKMSFCSYCSTLMEKIFLAVRTFPLFLGYLEISSFIASLPFPTVKNYMCVYTHTHTHTYKNQNLTIDIYNIYILLSF